MSLSLQRPIPVSRSGVMFGATTARPGDGGITPPADAGLRVGGDVRGRDDSERAHKTLPVGGGFRQQVMTSLPPAGEVRPVATAPRREEQQVAAPPLAGVAGLRKPA